VLMRVLFLCTHNAARSQMAEALCGWLTDGQVEAHSAGTRPTRPHPMTIRVLGELGIDWSQAQAKSLDQYQGQTFDWVITLCDDAAEACPVFPGAVERAHWPFPDPSAVVGSEEQQLATFRFVRDALREQLSDWLDTVAPGLRVRE